MSRAVLALGGNLGDRVSTLRQAVSALSRLPDTRIISVSGIYETKPVGFTDQPDFLNAAVLAETQLSPRALLGACLGIEAAAGRIRDFKDGSRCLDIDLLIYEGAVCSNGELELPHPRIRQRAFVLAPLRDLFPDGDVPGLDYINGWADLEPRMEAEGVVMLEGISLL